MSTVEELDKILKESVEQLVECTSIVRDLPLEPAKKNIYKIGKAIAEISELQSEIYKIHPHLKPEKWDQPLEEEDYMDMFENTVTWANEYIDKGKPDKAIEVVERFKEFTPFEKVKELADKKIMELKNEFAL